MPQNPNLSTACTDGPDETPFRGQSKLSPAFPLAPVNWSIDPSPPPGAWQ